MSENEAIKYLLTRYLVVGSIVNPPKEECEKHNAIIDMAIQALEEIQQYRAIGTLEECREAVEKMKPKKVITKPWSPAKCPTCGKYLSTNEGDGYYKHWFNIGRCPNDDCGQKLDWGE